MVPYVFLSTDGFLHLTLSAGGVNAKTFALTWGSMQKFLHLPGWPGECKNSFAVIKWLIFGRVPPTIFFNPESGKTLDFSHFMA